MRNVLVTGGAGFIGSHLVDSLFTLGDRVTVIDNLSTGNIENLNKVLRKHPEASGRLVIGDIRKSDSLDKVFSMDGNGRFSEQNYDIVFHLAAQTSVPASVDNPRYDFDVNVRGTQDIVERCLAQQTMPYFVYSSSAAVYGSHVDVPTREDALCAPESPYGASKLISEGMISTLSSRGLKSTLMRFSNVYGPGQSAGGSAGVIALFFDKLLKGKELKIFGYGEQTRDFVYVGDVVNALIHVGNNKLEGIYNVSSNNPVSINQLLHGISDVSGFHPLVEYAAKRKGDIIHSRLDNSKLRSTCWKLQVSLNEGLKRTYNHIIDVTI